MPKHPLRGVPNREARAEAAFTTSSAGRHSHHSHHKYDVDRPRVREDWSSRHASRQKPVDVSARNGVRQQHRRNHPSQARGRREQNWSPNQHRSRREYRHGSGYAQTKKFGAGFLGRLWEFCSLILSGCVGKPRRVGHVQCRGQMAI